METSHTVSNSTTRVRRRARFPCELIAAVSVGLIMAGCAQTTDVPDSQSADACPLAGTWHFDFDTTAQKIREAYAILNEPAWPVEPDEERVDPFEVTSLLWNYESMVDWEWTFECDRHTLIGPILGSIEVINDSPFTIENNAHGILAISSLDGDGDPTTWFVELLDNDCFEWYSSPDEHRVVWCRAE